VKSPKKTKEGEDIGRKEGTHGGKLERPLKPESRKFGKNGV